MAIDCFMKFAGIDGEATDTGHKGSIPLLSWDWSVSAQAPATGPRTALGKPVAADFRFTHVYNKASLVLARHCAQGRVIPQAVVTAQRGDNTDKLILKITLKEVFVLSVAPSFTVAGQGDILEAVALRCGEIQFAYTPYNAHDRATPPVLFHWDINQSTVS